MQIEAASILDYAPPQAPSRIARIVLSPWLLLPLIVILAASLRWYRIDAQSMWLDEFLAVENSTGRGQLHVTFPTGQIIDPAPHLTRLSDGPGFWKIWTSLKTETHPPLHFMLLNPWRHLFGEGDTAARSLSLLMSLVAIVAAFDVARLLHGKSVALWVALLMALAGAQIQYAQEARNYTTALALMLAAADAIVRMEQFGLNRKRIAALFVCILAMPLTHYLAAAIAFALFLYGLIRLRGRTRNVVALVFLAAGAVALIAWGPFFLEQSRRFGLEHAWQQERATDHVLLTFRRLALLPLRYFTEPMKKSMTVGQCAAVIYVLPLLLLWRRRDLLLWILLAAAAIAPVFLADLLRPASGLSLIRYTFLASVPIYILSAAMLAHIGGFARHAVPLVLAVSCALALEEPYSNVKADSRQLASFVSQHVAPDDLLVVYTEPDQQWIATSMYLGLSHYSPPKSPLLFLTQPPDSNLEPQMHRARRIWLMSPQLGIPNRHLFPRSRVKEAALFPYVGTIAHIEPATSSRSIPPSTPHAPE